MLRNNSANTWLENVTSDISNVGFQLYLHEGQIIMCFVQMFSSISKWSSTCRSINCQRM